MLINELSIHKLFKSVFMSSTVLVLDFNLCISFSRFTWYFEYYLLITYYYLLLLRINYSINKLGRSPNLGIISKLEPSY